MVKSYLRELCAKENLKLRILHIATQSPGFNNGGAIGTYLFSYSLTQAYGDVDYVGPIIEDKSIEEMYRNVIYFNHELTILEKIWTTMHCYFNRNYMDWKKEDIDFNQYDVIFVEFTKMDYYVRDIIRKKYKGKIIVRAHNVEQDFYSVNYKAHPTLSNFIKYKLSGVRESYIVRHSTLILAITNQDKARLCSLYGLDPDRVKIFPVCVNRAELHKVENTVINGKMKCLITGTLNFGPNSDATLWFINEVFPHISSICELTVAGNKPNEKIKEICNKEGVILVDTPETMKPLFINTNLVLAPIFDGGGMKVKIAESLSYGLPVITTEHGNIGYNLIDKQNGFIANTPEEFIQAIEYYYYLSENDRGQLLSNVWEFYKNNFSLDAAVEMCVNIIGTAN